MTISATNQGLRPGVCVSTARPSSPFDGQVIYETDTNRVLVWDNSAWVMIADTDSPPGLQLIKTQTIGTTVSSVEVTDAFSADYDDYRIIVVGGVASTGNNLQLTLGATTAGYYYGGFGSTYAGNANNNGGANVAFWVVAEGSTNSLDFAADISNPFNAKVTTMRSAYGQSATNGRAMNSNGFLNNTTSYTAFTITPSSGTLTGGIIKVYGYRNS